MVRVHANGHVRQLLKWHKDVIPEQGHRWGTGSRQGAPAIACRMSMGAHEGEGQSDEEDVSGMAGLLSFP